MHAQACVCWLKYTTVWMWMVSNKLFSFAVVELRGYDNPDKPAVCQVFIGNDIGNPIPHIHYQVNIND